MKYKTETTYLFFPDILLNIRGRDKVISIVMNTCMDLASNKNQIVTHNTKLFEELDFDISQINTVISEAGQVLMINFPYSLIFQQDKNISIEDIGGQLWKYMTRVIKYN